MHNHPPTHLSTRSHSRVRTHTHTHTHEHTQAHALTNTNTNTNTHTRTRTHTYTQNIYPSEANGFGACREARPERWRMRRRGRRRESRARGPPAHRIGAHPKRTRKKRTQHAPLRRGVSHTVYSIHQAAWHNACSITQGTDHPRHHTANRYICYLQ